MSEYGSAGNQPPGNIPSEDIRYDLNGNPLPAAPRSGGSPAPEPPPSYAPPPSQQPYTPPPPAYAPPPQQPYIPPPTGQYGYGSPPGYPPGPNGPVYGAPGAPPFGPPNAAAAPKSKVGLFVGIGVVLCLALFWFVFTRAITPETVGAPTAYKQYDSPDKSFSCTGPDGWTFVGSGVEGSQLGGVLLKKGLVKIDITSSDALSFMGDAMRSPAPLSDVPGMPPPPPPVEKIHAMTKDGFAEKYADYNELAAQPMQVPFGDTRVSEWTGTGGMFHVKVHGYRVTMLGLNKAVTIDCHCPDQNWDTMKPVFLKVIQSIVPGNG